MPSSLEQLLSTDELRDVGMDHLKRRMLMQLLLRDPVDEGKPDPTARDLYANRPAAPIDGILPDRSGDTVMAMKPSKGSPSRMARRQAGTATETVGDQEMPADDLLSALLQALKGK